MNQSQLNSYKGMPTEVLRNKLVKLGMSPQINSEAINCIESVLRERQQAADSVARVNRKPRKQRSNRNADRIDGYDRDDLGDSHD